MISYENGRYRSAITGQENTDGSSSEYVKNTTSQWSLGISVVIYSNVEILRVILDLKNVINGWPTVFVLFNQTFIYFYTVGFKKYFLQSLFVRFVLTKNVIECNENFNRTTI